MLFPEVEVTRSLSNLYKQRYVNGEPVSNRVIDVNERIQEKLKRLADEEEAKRKEEQRKLREKQAQENPDGFVEGLFGAEAEPEPEPEIDYVAQAQEEAAKILAEAEAKAHMLEEDAKKQAEIIKEVAQQEGYEQGYHEGREKGDAEMNQQRQELEQQREQLEQEYNDLLQEMEPQLLDTMLSIMEQVFKIQYSDKRSILLHLIVNAMENIRETRQFKIRVAEEDVVFVREQKAMLQEKVGEDIQIEIIMDHTLEKGSCVIDADSGVYDCSLDVELENLIRDLKSLCI